MHDHIHHVTAAPVVPDQVDRLVEGFQLFLKPVAVVEVGRRKAVGQCSAETRR